MKRPETKEKQYWDGDRFRHLLFIEHLEDYTNELEQQLKNCNLQNVNNRDFAEKFGQTIFNQFLKRWQNHGNDSEGVIVHGENMYEFIRVAKEIHGC